MKYITYFMLLHINKISRENFFPASIILIFLYGMFKKPISK